MCAIQYSGTYIHYILAAPFMSRFDPQAHIRISKNLLRSMFHTAMIPAITYLIIMPDSRSHESDFDLFLFGAVIDEI